MLNSGKKINILTLVLSEKKILNETKTITPPPPPPPLQVKWSVPYSSIIEKLDTLLENNPKKYWVILGNLIHADKPDNFEISSDRWFDYFKDLNKKTNKTFLRHF